MQIIERSSGFWIVAIGPSITDLPDGPHDSLEAAQKRLEELVLELD